jgi:hypothetical protein
MRLLKLFIISATFLFILVTAISLFIPSHVRISRATNVLATCDEVWQQVDDMRGWPNWNPFFSGLPAGKISYGDTINGKPGPMKVGGTTIQWKEMKPGERIALMQTDQKSIVNGWNCINHAGSDSTTLQWYLDFQLRWYPWEKFASLLFNQSYGSKMEQGLENMKKILHDDRTSIN